MWPSAVVLSQWLVTNPSVVHGKRVLEIGAGCGLTGLVAARLQKQYAKECECDHINHHHSSSGDRDRDRDHPLWQRQEVILSDFNTTVLQNLQRNVALNNVEEGCSVVGLDFYEQSGTAHHGWKEMPNSGVEEQHQHQQQQQQQQQREQVDVILAADMICQPADAVGAANTIHDALRPGGRAVVVCADSEHRFGVDIFESECRRVGGLEITVRDVGDLYDGKLYSSSSSGAGAGAGGGIEQTAGYVEGMSLIMFFIEKALQ
jgi:predicted nicotinamide N-methyase